MRVFGCKESISVVLVMRHLLLLFCNYIYKKYSLEREEVERPSVDMNFCKVFVSRAFAGSSWDRDKLKNSYLNVSPELSPTDRIPTDEFCSEQSQNISLGFIGSSVTKWGVTRALALGAEFGQGTKIAAAMPLVQQLLTHALPSPGAELPSYTSVHRH